MSRNAARVDDRIDSTCLDGPADHTPEGIHIAKGQAEHDGQKGTLEIPHIGDVRDARTGKGQSGGKEHNMEGRARFCSGSFLPSKKKALAASGCVCASLGKQRTSDWSLEDDESSQCPMGVLPSSANRRLEGAYQHNKEMEDGFCRHRYARGGKTVGQTQRIKECPCAIARVWTRAYPRNVEL